jgi:sodium/proline symporter
MGVIAIALVAGIVALNPDSSVLGLVSYAWAGFGAAFGPVVILSLFWRGYSRNGAVLTILVGAITVVVWKQLTGGIFDLYEIVPGFTFATLIGVVASKLSPPAPKTIADFDTFNAALKS